MPQQPFVVAPGASRAPGRIAVKVSGQDNGGAFAVLEVPTVAGAAPPLHVHHVENEWFYVLEGEYDIRVGDQVVRLKPGASAYGPKLIPHTWRDVGSAPGPPPGRQAPRHTRPSSRGTRWRSQGRRCRSRRPAIECRRVPVTPPSAGSVRLCASIRSFQVSIARSVSRAAAPKRSKAEDPR